jgi:hypothetical protein
MNTIQNNDAPPAAIASATAPRLIGIHVTLPPLAFWTLFGPETDMLTRLISTALNRRSLLVRKVDLAAFNHQVFGVATVTSLGVALSTVSGELSAVGLVTGAHLAWADASEGIWRTDRPLPEPMPFQSRIDAFSAWNTALRHQTAEARAAQFGQVLSDLSELLVKIVKRQAPTQLPPPAP